MEHEVLDLGIDRKRRAVRAHQHLLIHANGRGVKRRFAMLRLGKEHDPAARTNGIHRDLDHGVSAHRDQHHIGAATFGQASRGSRYVLPRIQRMLQAEHRRDGMTLGIQIAGEHGCAGALRQGR